MASLRGARDFVASFVTDLSRFDTRKVVTGLGDVADASADQADAAEDAARKSQTAVDNTASHAERSKGRFATAGQAIGRALGDGISGIFTSGGDVMGSISSAASSISSEFGKYAPEIGLAVGAGVAVAQRVLADLNHDVKASAEQVEAAFELVRSSQDKQSNIMAAVKQFTGKADFSEGLAEIKRQADEAGLSVDKIIQSLLTPGAARDLAGDMTKAADAAERERDSTIDGRKVGALETQARALRDLATESGTWADGLERGAVAAGDIARYTAETDRILGQIHPGNLERAANALSTIRNQVGGLAPTYAYDPAVAGGGRR